MNFSDEIDNNCCDNKIHCEVSDCIYHDCDNDHCTAKQIQVGPQNACCCSETICGTFKKK